jgi:hypothetical protein
VHRSSVVNRRLTRSILTLALVSAAGCTMSGAQDAAGLTRDGGSLPKDSGTGPASSPDASSTPNRTNCDDNPKHCVDHQLRDVPPFCACIAACELGYNWTGSICDPSGLPDGGESSFDSGGADDAALDADASPVIDAAPAPDSGANGDASANVGRDGATAADGGSFTGDSGAVADAAPGIGVHEDLACNASANNCENGDVCQLTGGSASTGICLRACNMAQNGPGYHNPACTGVGKDCVDIFGFGPSNGRCMNVFGPYQDPGETPLAVCDPAIANLFAVSGPNPNTNGLCIPLCTVTRSPTNPLDLTCSGRFDNCNTRSNQFTDSDGNFFAPCSIEVARGAVCGDDRGASCATGTDVCAEGLCRESIGATCTATTSCAAPDESCYQVTTDPSGLGGTRAFCARSCDPLMTGQCSQGQACTEIDDSLGVGVGLCRARTGTVAAGGGCTDVLDDGANATVCGEGTQCLPAVSSYRLECFALSPIPEACIDPTPTDNWTDIARCRRLCSPLAPQCSAQTTCTPLPGDFLTGVCQ